MKILNKLKHKTLSKLLFASLTVLTHSAYSGNIAYIHGDVSRFGDIPSGSLAPYEQMLLTNTTNRGTSEFRAMVEGEGHTISQYYDQNTTLNAAFLNQFDAVVFGLHQKVWSSAETSALDTWLQNGGGIMVYSDSAAGGVFSEVGIDNNTGQTAVNSLVSQYGMQVTVDQAGGTKAFQPTASNPHPVVDGLVVEAEGVSPVVVDTRESEVEVLIPYTLGAKVSGSNNLFIDPNPGVTIPQSFRAYAAVALRPVGNGNVIGFFDRQPLFNAGGPGADITKRDNEELLRRIVNFLAEGSGSGSGSNGYEALPRNNWTITASRNNGSTNNAIDGNATTRWSTSQSQRPGQLFTIDLGANEVFSRIVLETAANPNDYPRGYTVSVSNNGTNYTQVSSGTGSGTPTTITFTEQTARYIQIEQTGTTSPNWWSIHEINVFENVNSSGGGETPIDFPFTTSRDGWDANSDIQQDLITPAGMYLVVAAPNSDPYIFNDNLSFSGSNTNEIRVRLRSQQAGNVELYWETTEASGFNAARSRTLSYPTANVFQEFVFNMSNESSWVGKTITALRVDTTSGSGQVRTWFDYVEGNSSSGGGSGTTTVVTLRKRNAINFAIDVDDTALSNDSNSYMFTYNANDESQQWEEIERGNDYYTYKQKNSNFVLDGGSGGVNNQNVSVWTQDANNQDQHWKKVNVGSGFYRLEKRNAPNFSINGGIGGANFRNVKMTFSSNTVQNQHWQIDEL